MSTEIAIQVKNLSKCYQIYDKPQDRLKQSIFRGHKKFYRDFWALRDISFEVKQGGAIGIIGRNGAGKSTLLQLLCKTLTPTTGEILIKGRVAALLELGAGFNPEFTGRENVYLNGAVLGLSRQEIDERFNKIITFADIGEFLEQPVKTYSSGMFVRLAFAVQACVEPDVLIIDEALAVGDVFFRQKCYQRLRQLRENGTAILLVTHSMGDVEEFCDSAILLDQGLSIFQGKSVEAVKRYYLLEQQKRKIHTVSSPEVKEKPKRAKQINVLDFWPESDGWLDISAVPQISQGLARCTAIMICNSEGQAQHIFSQGETATFFYEFELLQDIEIPIGGILIHTDKGILVHGKHSLQSLTFSPNYALSGNRLRFKQDVILNISTGEYSCEVGLSAISEVDYVRRAYLSNAELEAQVTRLCHVPEAAVFTVILGSCSERGEMPFHGMTDLPGELRVILTTETENI